MGGLFDRQVQTFIAGAEDAVQKEFVKIIRRELEKVEDECRPTGTKRWIDGKAEAPIEAVKPFGVAFFEFSYWNEIIAAACNELIQRSPHDASEDRDNVVYGDNHVVYVNDRFLGHAQDMLLGNGAQAFAEVPADASVIILNAVQSTTGPGTYARRIEQGLSRSQAPGGVYSLSAVSLRQRFGNLFSISFTYIGILSGAVAQGAVANKSDNRYPALVIKSL